MIKIGFFGNPEFAKKVLEDIYSSQEFEICFSVTSVDKPVGRSQTLTETSVKEFSLSKGIPVFQPEKIRGNHDFFEQIRQYEADYFIVVAYGKILPDEILNMPKKLCINVHGSILPLYRGASPIQSALIAGDLGTGVTIMKMSSGMDEGDIIDMEPIKIDKFDTSETLFKKFEMISGNFLVKTLLEYDKGNRGLLPQNSAAATYCKKITKEDGYLDFNKRASNLFYLWRGLTPWPGIYTHLDSKKLIITKCDYTEDDSSGSIGEVVSGDYGIGIKCGKGILILLEVKLEGKGAQGIKDFINGRRDFIGKILT